MTAISWPLTGEGEEGVCMESELTAKDNEIICKEKSVVLSSIIFIIISIFVCM
jgi:hypothetical protein